MLIHSAGTRERPRLESRLVTVGHVIYHQNSVRRLTRLVRIAMHIRIFILD